MNFGKVAVLMGGSSSEREVSLNSGKAVLRALQSKGVDAHAFDPKEQDVGLLMTENFDRVFIVLHGGMGENGEIQGMLEVMGIPYTGSGVRACAISDDKYLSKLVWQAANLAVPRFYVLTNEDAIDIAAQQLAYPLFLKPTNEGSSVGVYKITNREDFILRYQELSLKYATIIAEEFLSGGEYSCPILGNRALPVIKIEPANEFYDYEAKYLTDDTVYKCPAGLSDIEEEAVRQLACDAFNAVGATGWGRVDIMRGCDGQFYILEINIAPGMTSHSLVPLAAKTVELDFADLCLEILSYAV